MAAEYLSNNFNKKLPGVSEALAQAVTEIQQLFKGTNPVEVNVGPPQDNVTEMRMQKPGFNRTATGEQGSGAGHQRISEIAKRFGTTGYDIQKQVLGGGLGGSPTSRLRNLLGPGDAARVATEEGSGTAGLQVSTIEQENKAKGVTNGVVSSTTRSSGRRGSRTLISLDSSQGKPTILGE